MNTKIKINEKQKEEMRQHIVDYFEKERDRDLGELTSRLILEFFIEELSPYIYNQGVEDAHVYMKDKVDDLFALQIVRI